MHGFIAVTDHEWFRFLRQRGPLDEVNFWRPSDTRTPRRARAWDAGDLQAQAGGDYQIGCLMLSQPVFLESGSWVRPPDGWPENAVQGKGYDLSSGEGARVWRECLAGAAGPGTIGVQLPLTVGSPERFGEPVLTRPRLGQGTFRMAVTGAYARACAVTLEHSLPALEAAHIRPYAEGGAYEVPNGLLLRSDIHKLYDKGYVGVTPEYRFMVSRSLKDDFSNGRSYYPLHGREIKLPDRVEERPSPEWLTWHMEEKFRR